MVAVAGLELPRVTCQQGVLVAAATEALVVVEADARSKVGVLEGCPDLPERERWGGGERKRERERAREQDEQTTKC